jgi:hypothetical protein
LYLLTTERTHGESFINSDVELLGASLAAYSLHIRFTANCSRREVWQWDERFFSVLQRLDARCIGANETYWSRVRDFLLDFR